MSVIYVRLFLSTTIRATVPLMSEPMPPTRAPTAEIQTYPGVIVAGDGAGGMPGPGGGGGGGSDWTRPKLRKMPLTTSIPKKTNSILIGFLTRLILPNLILLS